MLFAEAAVQESGRLDKSESLPEIMTTQRQVGLAGRTQVLARTHVQQLMQHGLVGWGLL